MSALRQPASVTDEPSNTCSAMTPLRSDAGEPECGFENADDESRDQPYDLPEEFGDWQDDYADAVGISRTKEL